MRRSRVLVAAQFLLIGLLIVTTRPSAATAAVALAAVFATAAAAVGIAALSANRPGNFNIRPEVKDGARLVTHGIYSRVRHPMYASVLLAMLSEVVNLSAAQPAGVVARCSGLAYLFDMSRPCAPCA